MKSLRIISFVFAFGLFAVACSSADTEEVVEAAEDAVEEVAEETEEVVEEAVEEAEEAVEEAAEETEEAMEEAAEEVVADAEQVEVYLVDALDDDNNYCIDISGGQADQVDGTEDLQAHTCYSCLLYTSDAADD